MNEDDNDADNNVQNISFEDKEMADEDSLSLTEEKDMIFNMLPKDDDSKRDQDIKMRRRKMGQMTKKWTWK